MKPNPYISKAIHQAKVLRRVVLQMNEKERALESADDEVQAELKAKKDSTDYPAEVMDTFFKEDKDYQEKVVADWEPEDPNEEVLFLTDRILYKLMSLDADKWINQDSYEEKTVLKLKEIVSNPFQLTKIMEKTFPKSI